MTSFRIAAAVSLLALTACSSARVNSSEATQPGNTHVSQSKLKAFRSLASNRSKPMMQSLAELNEPVICGGTIGAFARSEDGSKDQFFYYHSKLTFSKDSDSEPHVLMTADIEKRQADLGFAALDPSNTQQSVDTHFQLPSYRTNVQPGALDMEVKGILLGSVSAPNHAFTTAKLYFVGKSTFQAPNDVVVGEWTCNLEVVD